MSRYYASDFMYALLIFVLLAYVSLFISDASKNRLEVVVYLVKLIPTTIIGISCLLSRLVFALTTHSLALIINSLQISTQALQSGLQMLAELIKSFIVYLLQLCWEAANALVSSVLEIVQEAVLKSGEAFVEAINGIGEKGKEGVEALSGVIKEVAVSVVEMGAQVLSDMWSNFLEALSSANEPGE